MAYMSLSDSAPKTFRIRKDLVQTAAIRDFEYHTKLRLYDMPDKLTRPIFGMQQAVFDRTALVGRYRLLTVSDVIAAGEKGASEALKGRSFPEVEDYRLSFDPNAALLGRPKSFDDPLAEIIPARSALESSDVPLSRRVPTSSEGPFDLTKFNAVYQKVEDRGDGGVILENDYYLTGGYPGVAPGSQALLLIVTLQGLKEITREITRMSDSYYLEVWGRVLIEQGIAYFRHELRRALRRSGYQPTTFQYPGMKSCRLINQREIFRILEPEDLGVTLSPSCIMSPEKSFTCFTFANKTDQ